MNFEMFESCHSKMSQRELMRYIDCVTFAMLDCGLFLDTHPHNKHALEYYNHCCYHRAEATALYAKMYHPLTPDAVHMSDEEYWKWIDHPWPWEGGYQ